MSWAEKLVDAVPNEKVDVARKAMQEYGDKFSEMVNNVPFEDVPFLVAAVQIATEMICLQDSIVDGAVKELKKAVSAEMITFFDSQKEDN